MSFIVFKNAVEKKFEQINKQTMLRSSVTNDEIWDTYLESYPDGTNPIFRERTEHDCNCCKNFVRNVGKIVARSGNDLTSVWDVTVPEPYQTVANALSALVKSKPISSIYLSTESEYGSNPTPDNYSNIVWDHFHAKIPPASVISKAEIGTTISHSVSNKSVLERSILELSMESVEIVLDLIDQNSIYRGSEHKATVQLLKKCINEYNQAKNTELYLWEKSIELGIASKIKNSVIGSLLADISDGVSLEDAVKMFESKVAPQNYKRPTSLVTKGMIDKAQKKVQELGLMDSLPRIHANINDITINNVIFANRDAKQEMNVFDELKKSSKVKTKSFDKVEEISIDQFIANVLPKAESIEAYVQNNHTKNLVTLIAPKNKDSKNMLKWNNNFTWTYNGDVTDSIDQRVKSAGGNIDAVMRLSLAWDGRDDLDIHVTLPNSQTIYYSRKEIDGGVLDVDANGADGIMKEPVENVYWKSEPTKGRYVVKINNYSVRDRNGGFTLKFVVGDNITTITTNRFFNGKTSVLEFDYLGNGQVKIISTKYDVNSSGLSKKEWGIDTLNFHKVKLMMLSPNYWDDNQSGNKHYMFILEDCINPNEVRGFYNEFLSNELTDNRKVFEMLASKMKAPFNKEQLSGIGFSSTKRDELIVKVSGSFNRILKIKF